MSDCDLNWLKLISNQSTIESKFQSLSSYSILSKIVVIRNQLQSKKFKLNRRKKLNNYKSLIHHPTSIKKT
jgi:hypothetical protein